MIFWRKFIIAISISLTNPIYAGGLVNDAYVLEVVANISGWGIIKFDKPTGFDCPNGHDTTSRESLVFDLNKAGGQAAYSAALTAKVARVKVSAAGTGVCALMGDMEDGAYLKLEQM